MRRPLISALTLIALAACDRPPPPDLGEPPVLHGRRLIETTPDGPRARFDPGRRPVVRVTTPADWSLWWHHDDDSTRLPHTVDAREGVMFLRAHAGDPPRGPGTLTARVDDHVIARWPARWTPEPTDPFTDDAPLRALVDTARTHAAAGRLDAAEATALDAAALAERLGYRTEASRRLAAAAYYAHTRRALGPMSRHVERAVALADDATARAEVLPFVGMLALDLGEWRRAEAAYDAAADAAAEAGEDTHRRVVAEGRALVLTEVGLYDDALAHLRTAATPGASAADRSRLALNEGWILLRAMATGDRPFDADALRRHFAAAAESNLPAADAANLAVNRAWVELMAGELTAAARHLATARAADPDRATRAAPYIDLLDARHALAAGDPTRADARFAALDIHATSELGPDGGDIGWRADLGRARAARARGDLTAARRHLDRGLARLDRLGARTALRQSRVPFFADRHAIVGEAITAALAAGDPAAAFAIADRARGRVLRGLRALATVDGLHGDDARAWLALRERLERARAALAAHRATGDALAAASRAAWRRDLTALEAERAAAFDAAAAFLEAHGPAPLPTAAPPLAPGEAILAVVRPAADAPRLALWATPAGHHAAPLPDPLALPALPDGTRHLYLVTTGHPDIVRLAARASVERGFTLSLLPVAALRALDPAPAPTRPLVVADPTWELPGARTGGRAVAARFEDARLLVGDAATPGALRAALADADPLHFSGHGVLRAERPWAAHLVLAAGARFDIFDVLAARLPPGLVVLSGCETGADALSTRDDVLGLPEAFLVAGARAIIAADRVLPDAEARRFTELFYAHDGARHPGPALLAAARALRAEGHATWDAWRLVGRPHLAPRSPR